MDNLLEYGPIICVAGRHKGRIGYFDNEDWDCNLCKKECCSRDCDFETDDCENCAKFETKHGECPIFAAVYFGEMLFCSTYHTIPIEHCTNDIPMKDLVARIEILQNTIPRTKQNKKKSELLQELQYAQELFYEKHASALFANKEGKRLFISHSSKDKGLANCLYVDLIEHGHNPWLDDRDIKAGQSIPSEIQKGLGEADFILVLLSPNSVTSNWVNVEWESAYWDEVNNNKVKVIPILLKDCDIPKFLKPKKYVDFRNDYQQGLRLLLRDI